jgi:Domain of unknown function (DUF4192)
MTSIRLRGPADILATLPYQLGYHPQDAVVVVALARRTVGLVQRLDLPPDEQVDAAVAALLPALLHEQPDAVLLVGYESETGAARPVLDAAARACERAGLSVIDRLMVRDGRWYAPDCAGGCCPAEGTALAAAAEIPAVADFVAMEIAPVRDRASLAEVVQPDRRVCREVEDALAHLGGQRGFGGAGAGSDGERQDPDRGGGGAGDPTARWRRWLAQWAVVCDVSGSRPPLEGLAPLEVAGLALSLRDVALRDGLIAWLCPDSLPLHALDDDLVDLLRSSLPQQTWAGAPATPESVVAGRRLQARLAQLCRRVPDAQAAPMLTVLANFTWWLGDGALTRVALERALHVEPGYRLARLLDRMVDLAIRPRERQSGGVATAQPRAATGLGPPR